MKLQRTYRITGLALALVFAIFNIGLPVVVASCPMMKAGNSRACMMCDDGPASGTVTISRAIDKSCCATVFAADRNKTEFLQAVHHIADVSKFVSATVSSFALHSVIRDLQSVIPASTSPPLIADIPILVSSLLI